MCSPLTHHSTGQVGNISKEKTIAGIELWSSTRIDKLYTQIGNVNRLHNIIEPFAALFWALGIVLAHILQ